jgi:curved DNA-binding protein CbpA
MPMNIRRSLEILEIGADATEDEAKQAYKDLVAVWHPDRFSHNPRLKKKAEEKLKEANLAFETVQAFFFARGKKQTSGRKQNEKDGFSKTELAAELGTGAVLTLWSYLSDKINDLLSEENSKKKSSEKHSPHEKKGTQDTKER